MQYKLSTRIRCTRLLLGIMLLDELYDNNDERCVLYYGLCDIWRGRIFNFRRTIAISLPRFDPQKAQPYIASGHNFASLGGDFALRVDWFGCTCKSTHVWTIMICYVVIISVTEYLLTCRYNMSNGFFFVLYNILLGFKIKNSTGDQE